MDSDGTLPIRIASLALSNTIYWYYNHELGWEVLLLCREILSHQLSHAENLIRPWWNESRKSPLVNSSTLGRCSTFPKTIETKYYPRALRPGGLRSHEGWQLGKTCWTASAISGPWQPIRWRPGASSTGSTLTRKKSSKKSLKGSESAIETSGEERTVLPSLPVPGITGNWLF